MSSLSALQEQLATARNPVVITGAGISAPSGVDTFRKAGETSWSDTTHEALAQIGSLDDLGAVWNYWDSLRRNCAAAQPNPAHLALARWETWLAAQGGRMTILTQNIDDLHQQAGSNEVFPVHGSINRSVCLHCGDKAALYSPQFDHLGSVPLCLWCRTRSLRPDIVLFGEDLYHLATINERLAVTDLVVVVGTSGTVSPVNRLPVMAAANHVPCILINQDAWESMTPFGVSVLDDAARILPLICPS